MISKYLLNRNTFIAVILLFPILAFGQTTKQDSIWKPFKFFVGSWTGKGGREPSQGNYERKYQFIFENKFIEVHNKSVYPL